MRLSSISVVHKLAATLRFLAEGSYQRSVGKDVDIVVGRSTVWKIINETLIVLESKICSKWINVAMTEEEKQESKIFFQERFGIIGCVNGTHVKIAKLHSDFNLYCNRKG